MIRRAILLIAAALGYFTTDAQTRKISLAANRRPLSEVLQHIQNETGYNIVYSDDIISDTMLISISLNRVPVSELLDRILPAKDLFYKMMTDKMIVVGSRRFVKHAEDLAA